MGISSASTAREAKDVKTLFSFTCAGTGLGLSATKSSAVTPGGVESDVAFRSPLREAQSAATLASTSCTP